MIRKVLLSTVAMVAISGTAFAADLPSRRAPPVFIPPPIPVFTWTGFYIGGQVGYTFGRDTEHQYPGNVTFNVADPNGYIGGGHVGYNFSTQSLPIFGGFGGSGGVVGIEADVDGSDSRSSIAFAPGFAETDKSDLQGSVRGRLGVAVDRALFYVTGGAAFAEFKDLYNGVDNINHTRIGYTVGGGVEYALTTNWSLRAEYRYSDFGTYSEVAPVTLGAATVTHRIEMQRAQVGFSYKFDNPAAPAPVVARY